MAEKNMTMVTRAQVDWITTAATGRKAFVLDGMTIELGFTGVMDVTSLALGLESGKIELWRSADKAVLNFVNAKPAAAAGSWLVFDDLPVGFRTVSVAGGEGGLIGAGSTGFRRTNWTKNGDVAVVGVLAADVLNGSVEVTAGGWPSALIGAAPAVIGWV